MQHVQGAKPAIFLLVLLFVASDNSKADWSADIYGGEYYDDNRFGTYLVLSDGKPQQTQAIAEVLYEQYTGYEFAGIGGHLLWPVSQSTYLGLIASQSWETYEFSEFDDIDYHSNTAGLELEFNGDWLTLAAQTGMYFSDFDDTDAMYLSADLYYLGEQGNWYLRGAIRRISNDSLYIFEGYRSFSPFGLPLTAYLGANVGYPDTEQDVSVDSIYTGVYAELFSAPSSALFLWMEAAEVNDEALLSIELSLVFGPGAKTPYITAFGTSLQD